MGFNPPVPQSDSDWEIRVAVLWSLLMQVILIFVGPIRKRSSCSISRFAVWSSYLLADWVADLCLGLLLNNLAGNIGGSSNSTSTVGGSLKRGGGGGASNSASGSNSNSPSIFAFWTPFLLLHLGGPDTITAYSIDDNELWLRHLVGLLFELFSAMVVFVCSLQGNPMVVPTSLMLVAGVIKYGERTYSLYAGSIDGMLANILRAPDPGANYAKLMTAYSSRENSGLVVEIVTANGQSRTAEEMMEEERISRLVSSDKLPVHQAHGFFLIFRSICYDISLSYHDRKKSQAYFIQRRGVNAARAFEMMEVELNFLYDMVHTKAPVAHSKVGWALRSVCSACLLASLAAFLHLDKADAAIRRVDVAITYALLLGALALDAAALAMLVFFSDRVLIFLEKAGNQGLVPLKWLARLVTSSRPRVPRWSETITRLNLITYCLGWPSNWPPESRRRWRPLRWLLDAGDALGMRDNITRLFVLPEPLKFVSGSGQHEQEQSPILNFLFDGLKVMATQAKRDYMEMRKECSYRGERVLSLDSEIMPQVLHELTMAARWQLGDPYDGEVAELRAAVTRDKIQKVLLASVVRRDFDESLVIWHIATDLCFFPSDYDTVPNRGTGDLKVIAQALSEYMLCLLIRHPKLLSASAGGGQMTYWDTCAEARRFFKTSEVWNPDHEDARRMMLRTNTSVDPVVVKGGRCKSVLFDACILAKVLRQLNVDTMWTVITGVWREMVIYAAARSKGTTHLRELSRGGQLITMVWFLMAHMGIGDVYHLEEGEAKPKLIVHDL